MANFVSREAAIELLTTALDDEWEPEYATDRMNEIPAADVREVRRGKWVFDNPLTADFMCDNCLERQITCTPFCPYCGADMRPEPPKEEA